MRRDPVLAAVIKRVGPCAMEHRGDPYRMLVQSVVYQQLAGAAARTIDKRLRAPWRGRYPQPAVLLEAPAAQLRAAGLSRQKIKAVRSVAQAFANGDVSNRALRAWTTRP
jgi:DNA-3-methyladenine glycosylase II